MSAHVYRRRYAKNIVAQTLASATALLALIFLAWILWVTVSRGVQAIGLPLFTKITAYADQGGLANAIVGSFIIDVTAIAMCAPGRFSPRWK